MPFSRDCRALFLSMRPPRVGSLVAAACPPLSGIQLIRRPEADRTFFARNFILVERTQNLARAGNLVPRDNPPLTEFTVAVNDKNAAPLEAV